MSIYVRSKTDAGIILADSTEQLESPQIVDLQKNKVDCPLIREQQLADGSYRYWFDAAALEKWTPDTPVLYYLSAGGELVRFGYMELKADGDRALLLNGDAIYMRGYIRGYLSHEHPNMTGGSLREAAIKNIRQAKKYGFNLVRFHSTIPTPEFVEAADEEGMFIHMEIGFEFEMNENAEKKNISMNNRTWEETIMRYRNNPSAAIFCIGNELHNSGHYKEVMSLYNLGKSLAPAKLIMDNSGWGEFDRQTADVFSQHMAYYFPFKHHGDMFNVDDPWRINGSAYDEPFDLKVKTENFQGDIHRTILPARPTLSHESCHYIDIPDYEAMNKKFDDFCASVTPEYLEANGIVKPKYLTEVPKLIARKKLQHKMPDYMAASQLTKKNALKKFLEKCRLSSLCGFEMLQFADCFVYENKNGIVDFFDDDKNISPEWMMQFNGDAAVLADFESEVYFYGDEIKGDIYISNYLTSPVMTGGDLTLSVEKSDGTVETVYAGHNVTLNGRLQKIASLSLRFSEKDYAQEIKFAARFTVGDIELKNEWKLWLYPKQTVALLPAMRLNDPALQDIFLNGSQSVKDQNVIVTDVLDDQLFADLENGKTVYLLYHRDKPGHQYYIPGALERFKPCIWDRGSNLGGIIYPAALRQALGNERYFDFNWYSLLEAGYKVCLDDFPVPVEELVCGVDKPVRDRMKRLCFGIEDYIDADTLRNFSHLFSVNAGKGTLVVCTLVLTGKDDPATNAFNAALFNNPELVKTDKNIPIEVLKNYLAAETAKGVRREDTMNHFWEIDNKLVEDAEFWREANIDLRKIR